MKSNDIFLYQHHPFSEMLHPHITKNPKSDHTSITWQSLGKNQFLYIDSTQAMTFPPNWEDPPPPVACLKLWPLAPQTPASIKALTVAVLQQNSCQKKLIAVGVFYFVVSDSLESRNAKTFYVFSLSFVEQEIFHRNNMPAA